MSKVIHKFGPLRSQIETPFYGKPVFVGLKHENESEEIYLWCEVDTSKPGHLHLSHVARFIATGYQTYEDDETYVGSVINSYGLVWHVLSKKV